MSENTSADLCVWRNEEDIALREGVALYGVDWMSIKKHMARTKSVPQIRARVDELQLKLPIPPETLKAEKRVSKKMSLQQISVFESNENNSDEAESDKPKALATLSAGDAKLAGNSIFSAPSKYVGPTARKYERKDNMLKQQPLIPTKDMTPGRKAAFRAQRVSGLRRMHGPSKLSNVLAIANSVKQSSENFRTISVSQIRSIYQQRELEPADFNFSKRGGQFVAEKVASFSDAAATSDLPGSKPVDFARISGLVGKVAGSVEPANSSKNDEAGLTTATKRITRQAARLAEPDAATQDTSSEPEKNQQNSVMGPPPRKISGEQSSNQSENAARKKRRRSTAAIAETVAPETHSSSAVNQLSRPSPNTPRPRAGHTSTAVQTMDDSVESVQVASLRKLTGNKNKGLVKEVGTNGIVIVPSPRIPGSVRIYAQKIEEDVAELDCVYIPIPEAGMKRKRSREDDDEELALNKPKTRARLADSEEPIVPVMPTELIEAGPRKSSKILPSDSPSGLLARTPDSASVPSTNDSTPGSVVTPTPRSAGSARRLRSAGKTLFLEAAVPSPKAKKGPVFELANANGLQKSPTGRRSGRILPKETPTPMPVRQKLINEEELEATPSPKRVRFSNLKNEVVTPQQVRETDEEEWSTPASRQEWSEEESEVDEEESEESDESSETEEEFDESDNQMEVDEGDEEDDEDEEQNTSVWGALNGVLRSFGLVR
ncbi:hypothetical protein BJ742DRAFT_773911 [Cladochytrium replicatum]|nr:hypothetical protein BJ742DRAFT_773911 [Cladochytrium replicatum]